MDESTLLNYRGIFGLGTLLGYFREELCCLIIRCYRLGNDNLTHDLVLEQHSFNFLLAVQKNCAISIHTFQEASDNNQSPGGFGQLFHY